MVKVVALDDAHATGDAQEIPGVGLFPHPVAGSGHTEAEWRKRIADEGLPLVVRDRRTGDAMRDLARAVGEQAAAPVEASGPQPGTDDDEGGAA